MPSKLLQSCPTLHDRMDHIPPGSSVHEILQAKILEWVVIPSPEDLPDLGIKPGSPALQVVFLPSESRKTHLLEKESNTASYMKSS